MPHFCRCAFLALALPMCAAYTPAWATGCAVPAGADIHSTSSQASQSGEPLTLNAVVSRIASAAPEVRAAALEAQAAGADADQAGQWLNPVLSLETENVLGSGSKQGFDEAETTLAVAQTFQLGNKRQLGERAARARAALAVAECRSLLLAAQLQGAELFVELTAAQRLAALAGDAAANAARLAAVAEKRVSAGAAAPPELARAKADAAIARAAADAAKGEVEAKAQALAASWGGTSFHLPEHGSMARFEDRAGGGQAKAIASSAAGLQAHPRMARARAAANARRAETDQASMAAMPDLTVSAGVKRFENTGDNALRFGVSLPLPLFDDNSDGARAARLRADGAALSEAATETRLKAERAALQRRLEVARDRLQRLRRDALPQAGTAYDASVKGYRMGKFTLTDALDAKRSLIETRTEEIRASLSLDILSLRLAALTGAAPFSGDR